MMTKLEETAAVVGAKVKQRRTRLGLSQAQLAQRIGMERAHLTRLEQGTTGGDRGLGLGLLVRIADGLGCHVTDLLPKRSRPSSPVHA